MMNFSMGDVVGFPSERRRAGDMNFVRTIAEVWLDAVVGGIEHADASHLERVTVKIGSEGIAGDAPNALIVFLQWEGIRGAFDGDSDFFGVWRAETENDAVVGMDFGRDDRRWRRRRSFGLGVLSWSRNCDKSDGQ